MRDVYRAIGIVTYYSALPAMIRINADVKIKGKNVWASKNYETAILLDTHYRIPFEKGNADELKRIIQSNTDTHLEFFIKKTGHRYELVNVVLKND